MRWIAWSVRPHTGIRRVGTPRAQQTFAETPPVSSKPVNSCTPVCSTRSSCSKSDQLRSSLSTGVSLRCRRFHAASEASPSRSTNSGSPPGAGGTPTRTQLGHHAHAGQSTIPGAVPRATTEPVIDHPLAYRALSLDFAANPLPAPHSCDPPETPLGAARSASHAESGRNLIGRSQVAGWVRSADRAQL
jgi:hypothetical protein